MHKLKYDVNKNTLCNYNMMVIIKKQVILVNKTVIIMNVIVLMLSFCDA